MNQQKRRFPPILIYLIFIAVLVIGAFVISNFGNRSESVTYTEYLKDLKEGQIKKAEIISFILSVPRCGCFLMGP